VYSRGERKRKGEQMFLTDDEKKMFDGQYGEGVAKAMRVQMAIGEAFGAERMVEITRAHESFGATEANAWFLEQFSKLDAQCRVPTTCNPMFDLDYLESVGKPVFEEDRMLLQRTREAKRKLGIIPNDSCTPYLQDNVPRFGEIIAFAESSATPYVNSVYGAKSHREAAHSALAAAITGRVPLYGSLLDENRKGEILVKVEATVRDDYDYHLLGYVVGNEVGIKIPVFTGMSSLKPSPEELTALGAQLATGGAVGMYHIIGITPEAPDLETAFGSRSPEREVIVTDADLKKAQELLSDEQGRIDFIMFGCPHYTLNQVRDVARLLEGKTLENGIELWVLTSSSTREFAKRMGYLEIINNAGGHVIANTCTDQICWQRLYEGKRGIVDSFKTAYYTRRRGVQFVLRRRSECIEAGLRGGY
jgi:predicted aconitase